jgi:2-amino-4-hydroxy-6-hydroxymethyldihydropteridine diphosphokinase
MSKCILLLGGNLGEVINHFKLSSQFLSKSGFLITEKSSIFTSKAWGFESDDIFYNQVLITKTELSPSEVLYKTQSIEQQIGRKSKSQNGTYQSRLIDIDILFYDDMVLCSERLTIPHPKLHERMFTLVPLQELIPEFIHPALNQSISELVEVCPDKSTVNIHK